MRPWQCRAEWRLRSSSISLTIVCALSSWLQPAEAHHSFAGLFTDEGEEVIEVYDGSIEIYKLLNPHTALLVNAINDSGVVEDWLVEMSSLAALVREGWADDSLNAGDKVTIAILRARAPKRGRLRAVLVHGAGGEDARLLVAYGIRGDTPVMRRLADRLPYCGTIDGSLGRSQCFLVDASALTALQEDFPGKMGYVMP